MSEAEILAMRIRAREHDNSVVPLIQQGRTIDALEAISRAQGLRQKAFLAEMQLNNKRER